MNSLVEIDEQVPICVHPPRSRRSSPYDQGIWNYPNRTKDCWFTVRWVRTLLIACFLEWSCADMIVRLLEDALEREWLDL